MSQLYPAAKAGMLQGLINLSSGAVKLLLIDTDDDAYDAANVYLSDLAGASIVATSTELLSKTFVDGVFDAADISIPAVTGDQSEAIILFIDTGTPATSRLIAFIDNAGALSFTPNGGALDINFSGSGIFAL